MKKIKTNKHVHKIPSFDKKDTYIGEHRNKKKHGQGTYTYVNGDTYTGEPRNEKIQELQELDVNFSQKMQLGELKTMNPLVEFKMHSYVGE